MHQVGFAFFAVLLLASCADRSFAPIVAQAETIGITKTVLVATTRDKNADGFLDSSRRDDIGYFEVDVSIPPDHKLGKLRQARGIPDPTRHFAISRQQDLASASSFQSALNARLAQLPPSQREVIVYVHGYNNSFADSVFRIAQLDHDFDVPGIPVAYSWPSSANALGYSHDRDSALFARDGLESFLRHIKKAGARRVILVAHSMGSLLVMEALRQIEIATPGWSKHNLDGVMLISPDISLDLFKKQARRIRELPEPFAVFVSKRDRVLSLSARINGASQRLGQVTDAAELSEFPLTLLDVSDFSDSKLGPGHFTVGTSPALITLVTQSQALQNALQQDPSARAGPIPGTVITVQKATQIILSPGLLLAN